MKTILCTLLALTLAGTTSFARSTDAEKAPSKATISLASTSSSYQKLVDQISTLTEEIEELRSELAYEQMMKSMFARLACEKQLEEKAEMEAANAYNKMMAQLMIKLRSI